MSDGTQCSRQIAAKGPDVGALAASDHEICMVRVRTRHKFETVDDDPPGLEVDGFAGSGQVIGPLSADLEGRKGWGNLLDVADEGGERLFDCRVGRASVAGGGDFALAILRRACLAETHG